MTTTHSSQPSKGRFLAYLRVSTPKQGEGSSLITQREAIARFATRRHLEIVGWYEEKESAARRGRPVFGQVLRLLAAGKADGLIVHKVDRSARNLKDWADLGELIDRGIPVYFAGDGFDLSSRGGRLAADIQAVIAADAADYVRNLKEEAKRGIRARLEQGFYPNHAPIGYLDTGPARAKIADPERAPFIRMAFSWYASGDYTLHDLSVALLEVGLRNRAGGHVSASGLSNLLRNPFYIGYIRMKSSETLYPGLHEGLVSRETFFAVQARLRSRVWPKRFSHRFRFSRMFKCAACQRSLTGEEKKGHVYYRCHGRKCPTKTSVREEVILDAIRLSGKDPSKSCFGTVLGKTVKIGGENSEGSNPSLYLPASANPDETMSKKHCFIKDSRH